MMTYEDPALSYEADLTRQRDELAAALRKIADWPLSERPGHCDYLSRADVVNIARAALAKVPQ